MCVLKKLSTILMLGFAMISCGQDPSFGENAYGVGDESIDGEGVENTLGEDGLDQEVVNGSNGQTDGGSDHGNEGIVGGVPGDQVVIDIPNSNPEFDPDIVDVPDADDGDMGAIRKCLRNFQDAPFGNQITNYKKIKAAVTVFGVGVSVDDRDVTEQPQLVLIDAAVNVMGSTTYNLLNPNGYYCINTAVNVGQELNINLDCQARLSDSKVHVNVGSNTNSTIAEVGVHVSSEIKVNHVGSGNRCVR